MDLRKLIGVLLIVLPLSQAHGQGVDRNGNVIPPRSPVVLLPNYKLQVMQGIDTTGGRIWKRLGVVIEYGQGPYLENEAEAVKKDQILWKQEQVINKQKIQCVFTKSRELVVSFPSLHASFQARVNNQQELTDMLLMVLTYDIDGYPVDAASLAPLPKNQKD